ncbi:hypothetical protein TRFO_23025 [Tritrichomonas foetus]|uniref:Dynein regulatory complex subunit 3 n=1 Tax=Tritrichomonas foetus TaxID=1144522 RepID=A0A1J4KC06_9EUKA|nr:hypothetical protein TRFO_23025 [Tritrichomonas foetus]|eukprot:OHT08498.1 hypothetical protein TRFO_23025 [Tritrichomonas foetus]
MQDDELTEPHPVVINEALLQYGARDGLTPAERERLEDAEKHEDANNCLQPPEVKVLRLTYMHIRKIDNLQCYTALQELYLANNIIKKIENLSTLTTLRKLDLSFNLIEDFEGLEALENLEELSLFKNQITKLQNFPILKKLRLLSLGRNKIADLNEIRYFYKLKALRVLTLIDNPIHDKDIYKLTVLAYLPGLQFLDYTRVLPSDITDAKERHSDQIANLQTQDNYELSTEENQKAADARAKLHREAFLNKIVDLHLSLFKKDNDHTKLRTINEIAQPYMQFVDDLSKTIEGFKNDIITQFRLLNEEEEQFNQAYSTITENNRLEMVAIVKDLERKRRAFMNSLNTEEEQTNDNPNDDEENIKFIQEIENVKDQLFTSEFSLVDQVSEMIHMYESELDDRNNAIIERINSFFGIVRNLETDYNEKVTDICMKLWERFNQGEAVEVTDEIRSILVDKDTLLATITQSHEHRITKLYRRQEDIANNYKNRIDNMTATSRQTDLERNRRRIAEISNYMANINSAIQALEGGDDDND